MQISVVINTYNRAESLRVTLEALRRQTHPDFEVVVVNGPSTDGTAAMLESRADAVRVVDCPERHLSKSRNLGIDAAAGDVVAFIDDDGIPEPRWLEDLAAAYADERVGGAGGLVLDQTGVTVQYRYSVCDRIGLTNFDLTPPFDAFNVPGADPYVYLQGTNCSFRRSVLEQVSGFDEEIEYNYDEAEVCLQVIDAGHRLAALDNAVVHHRFLPSHQRRAAGLFTDPYLPVKNRAYFALRNGAGHYGTATILSSLVQYTGELRAWAKECVRNGSFTKAESEHFLARMEAGFDLGVERGLAGQRQSRPIAARRPEDFKRYPTLRPEGRRLGIVFASLDYPPKPLGGVGRFTHDLARGMAAEGHDIHVVTRDDTRPYTVDFEEGVWVHRFPVGERWLPDIKAHPLRGNFEHLASVYGAVANAVERFEIDVVSGNAWIAEPLFCAFDPRFESVMTCASPMRVVAETQPVIAAQEHTPWQIKLEDLALRSMSHLQSVSHANLDTIAKVEGVDRAKAEVIWLGIVDRRAEFERTRDPEDDTVELLFVGRLEPRKGTDTFLDAAVGLVGEDPRVRIKLVGADTGWGTGGETYEQRLTKQLAGQPELLARFTFTGMVPDDDLYDALANADVFCSPSRYESFGLVIGEAMMMGLPAVACDAGGMPELIAAGETGLLVPPGDTAALQAALGDLVRDRALRERMGRAGRERFEREFRNEITVERTIAYYRTLAEGHQAAGVSGDRARSIVSEHVVGVLQELTGIDGEAAERAARRLLDPATFPHDVVSAVTRALQCVHPRTFVEQLYEAVLQRAADDDGLHRFTEMLVNKTVSRMDVVHAVVKSDEAQAKGVDATFLERFDVIEPGEALRAVRAVWTMTDPEFARGLLRELEGREPSDADVDALTAQLRTGSSRRDVLAATLRRDMVQTRVIAPELLLEADLKTRADIDRELGVLARRTPEEFVSGLYPLLLDRPADPDGLAGFVAQLRAGVPRLVVVRALVDSDEARIRGLEPSWLDGLQRRVPALDGGRVARRVRQLPGGRRAVGVSRRVTARKTRPDAQLTGLRSALEAIRRERQHASRQLDERLTQETTGVVRRILERTEADFAAVHLQFDEAYRRIEELDGRFGAAVQGTDDQFGRLGAAVQRTGDRLDAVDARIDVLARKHEAVAMDLRERVAIQPPSAELPEPTIVNGARLDRDEVKLNLGCGEKPLPGYINVDFRELPGVDIVADARRLPFEPGTVDELMSAHLVEHFRQHHLATVLLPYWRSLLDPEHGVLRVICPNWAVMIEQFNASELAYDDFKTVTFGQQDYSGDDHFAMYTPESLSKVLTEAGFDRISVVTAHRQNGMSPEMELTAHVATTEPS